MTDPRHLPRAPIKEAVIDLRVDREIDVEVLDFSLSGFTKGSRIQNTELRLELHGPNLQHQESQRHIGYRHEAGEGKDIAQLTTAGLTLSRLTPYQDWNTFLSLAKKAWGDYSEAVGNVRVGRVGVRYVNRLNVPQVDQFSLDDYFTNAPKLFIKSRSEVDHFLTRLVLKLSDTPDVNAVVVQTIDKLTDDRIPLILDIDVFARIAGDDELDVWDVLDELRHYKNDIFFNTMTPKSLDLCK